MKLFYTIRARLTVNYLTTILTLLTLTSSVAVYFIYDQTISLAQNKVRLDLNTAREVYNNSLKEIKTLVHHAALRPVTVREALRNNDIPTLRAELESIKELGGLDFLVVTDAESRVILRVGRPHSDGGNTAGFKIIAAAINYRETVGGTEIIRAEELAKEGKDLAETAHIDLIETPKAKPTADTERTDGMVLKAAAPVFDDDGSVLGVICGGKLLNRRYEIVDHVKEIVYRDEKYKEKDIGTVTIFLGDLRISTNVRNDDGTRAIGTRVSEEVYNRVLNKGKVWIGRAFVVNAWYITAYEPIENVNGDTIGILYVGVLEKPFRDLLVKSILGFLLFAVVAAVIVIFIARTLARRVSNPLTRMEEASRRIVAGDFTSKIEYSGDDEMGRLAGSFNHMQAVIARAREKLTDWSRSLETQLEQRTEECRLFEAQLAQSEKLASVGRLAAGIAHEINNPLTSILANITLMLEDLDEKDEAYEDLSEAAKETLRCREIVKGLLDFARQTKPEKRKADVNEMLRSVLHIIRNQAVFQDVRIREDFGAGLPHITADMDQLKQVCMNVLINAAEVLEEGGVIAVSSALDEEGGFIVIEVADTGKGISREDLRKVFDPFYTTKETGTGLGLAVSHGIIERHGGTIAVRSKVGEGTTVTIRLPVNTGETADENGS